ncbi:MAG: zinc-ribbon domain-containing protein, partial [Acidobacteria bacterium]|nr:zinc-ribbon domain-containing protein [Acidobacteriota bacterium]
MVRCLQCGRENEEGMRFCTNCGSAMTTTTQTPAAGGYDSSTSETISFNASPQTSGRMGTPTTPTYTA